MQPGRFTILLLTVVTALGLCWGAIELDSPQAALAQGAPPAPAGASQVWVATHSPTEIWSGPEADAVSFGSVRIGFPFRVLAPQEGSRLLVFNLLTDNIGWIDAGAVGPIPTPTEEQIAALLAPPPFEAWWAMTHTPAIAWSGPGPEAVAWTRIPQWRYLQVIAPEESGRALTLDPRNDGYGYVDINALGAVGAPPTEYFAAPPPDEETLALPGRVIGTVDSFERPSREQYFALERLFHADAVTVQGLLERDEGTWYRIGDTAYIPSESVRVPRLPERTFPGRWIDANLSEPVLVTAYEDEHPVYTALAVKGTVAFQTPTGVFRILRRVPNETMDSLTIGIPRTAPTGYYLKDVLFTQYFTGDGAALHYNYWRSNWGYAGSHGCMGMNYDDSKFFWDFATVGTPVYVHF
jgi:L,D-transpeptidase catalytic domain